MNRVGTSPTPQAGFTLLEAIVALTLFSLGALALFGWLGTSMATFERVEDDRLRLAASRSALDLLRQVNPMQRPEGLVEIENLRVAWRSEPILAPTDGMSQVGRPTLYEIALYRLDVEISLDGRELPGFSVRQVGWRQVRAVEFE